MRNNTFIFIIINLFKTCYYINFKLNNYYGTKIKNFSAIFILNKTMAKLSSNAHQTDHIHQMG